MLAAAAVGALVVAFAGTLASLEGAFCGGRSQLQIETGRQIDKRAPAVTMNVRSRMYNKGQNPNFAAIQARKMKKPSVTNMKDQYYIIWVRSKKVKQWKAINIISGAEMMKNMKKMGENEMAKAVGVGQLANWQLVRSIGLQLYQQKDEVNKNAVEMHPMLKSANGSLEYGYKEILDNVDFNKSPYDYLKNVNISLIPPEDELRNILDDAGDAVKDAGTSISKVGDSVKGFFGGLSR